MIGYNLLHSIPEKHRHLINHLELKCHSEMMKILVSEFGRSRLIVDDVVGQLSKINPVTTDKSFLDFVEILEKIHFDLTTLNKISAVANPTILSDLESKLPTLINIHWHKVIEAEDLDEKEDIVIYQRFLTFLNTVYELNQEENRLW